MPEPQPIVVADDKEAALAQLADIPADQLPEGFEVLSTEEAQERLDQAKAENEATLAELSQHPDPRFGVSIQDGALALAKVEELIDFTLPPGSTGRIAFDLQFETGTYAKLIEGAKAFQQQLVFGVSQAQVEQASGSKLIVPE